MGSTTYYLKYRPQKLSELDLVEVRETLVRALKAGQVPHALLCAGPRGIGKTSSARIIAKAVNCLTIEKRKKEGKKGWYEPCGRCGLCESITKGTALDLIEVDGASNRGIDDIRQLKDKIKLSPARARYKVYIIDEVHMLTTEAFNALLKTLEEPPDHAIFILCTTAPEKLPNTIVSRCMRLNFKKASPAEVVGALKKAVKGEKLEIEKGVLEQIAKVVDGSFRDAHKLLQQLAASGDKISLKETEKVAGQGSELDPIHLLTKMAAKDLKGSFAEIERVVQRGGDLTTFFKWLLERLRMVLLVKLGVDEDQSADLVKLAQEFEPSEVMSLISLFSEMADRFRLSPIPQLPLELAAMQWCQGTHQDPVNGQDGSKENVAKAPPVPANGVSGKPVAAKTKTTVKPVVPPAKAVEGDFLGEVEKQWDEFLAGLRPLNHSVEALMRSARPLKAEGKKLVLEVFYSFHKERLESDKCRSIVEQVAEELFGRSIRVSCVLGEKKSSSLTSSSDEPSADVVQMAEKIFGSTAN